MEVPANISIYYTPGIGKRTIPEVQLILQFLWSVHTAFLGFGIADFARSLKFHMCSFEKNSSTRVVK
jgi:hypothetical protein